ncbi:MAG TPA: hypothetical protein VFQ06_15565 [Nitrospira sp.]|nr:hypothetical protein [Nitrospira sp.]
MSDPTLVVQMYTLSLLPVEHPLRSIYQVVLERRPDDRWVVKDSRSGRSFLSVNGEWNWGPDGDEEWVRDHWHSFDRAVELARRACRDIRVNGNSAEDVLKRRPDG